MRPWGCEAAISGIVGKIMEAEASRFYRKYDQGIIHMDLKNS